MAYDQPAAYAVARKLLDGELKDNPNALYMIARDLTDPPGPKTKDRDLAMAICQRAVELSPNNPSHLATLAEAYAGKADYAKAIETMELALAKSGDLGLPEGSVTYLKKRLESFRNAAANAKSE